MQNIIFIFKNKSQVTNISGILVIIVQQGFTKRLSDIFKVFDTEMSVSSRTERRTAKWSFHCVTVLDAHQPNDYTSCVFLWTLNVEIAIFEWKLRSKRSEYNRINYISFRFFSLEYTTNILFLEHFCATRVEIFAPAVFSLRGLFLRIHTWKCSTSSSVHVNRRTSLLGVLQLISKQKYYMNIILYIRHYT